MILAAVLGCCCCCCFELALQTAHHAKLFFQSLYLLVLDCQIDVDYRVDMTFAAKFSCVGTILCIQKLFGKRRGTSKEWLLLIRGPKLIFVRYPYLLIPRKAGEINHHDMLFISAFFKSILKQKGRKLRCLNSFKAKLKYA